MWVGNATVYDQLREGNVEILRDVHPEGAVPGVRRTGTIREPPIVPSDSKNHLHLWPFAWHAYEAMLINI